MKTQKTQRLVGLTHLVEDAVTHGASAIERVHVATAARPFAILAQIPGVAGPASLVRAIHDASVAITYAAVRGVTRMTAGTAAVLLGGAPSPRPALPAPR